METSDNFSISRMLRYIRFDFVSNKKSYIMRISLIAIILFLVMLLVSMTAGVGDVVTHAHYCGTIGIVASWMLAIALSISLSYIFEPMKTIGGRINHLMLPASKAEKFTGRLIISTLGLFAAFIVAILVTESVRNVVLLAFGDKYSDVIGFDFFGIVKELWGIMFVDKWLTTHQMFGFSTFLLGGALWYNYSFVKTLFAQTVIGMGLLILGGFFSILSLITDWLDSADWEVLYNVSFVVAWVIMLAMWVLTYQLYRRASIVNKRFIFKQ